MITTAYYTLILSFYHSHYVRICSTLSIVARSGTHSDGQSLRIVAYRFSVWRLLWSLLFITEELYCPLGSLHFRRKAKSLFIHKIDIRNVSTITCSITSLSYNPITIFQFNRSKIFIIIISSHSQEDWNNYYNFNRNKIQVRIVIQVRI